MAAKVLGLTWLLLVAKVGAGSDYEEKPVHGDYRKCEAKFMVRATLSCMKGCLVQLATASLWLAKPRVNC